MQSNTLKAKLAAGETTYGVFTRYPDATLVEVLTFAGWDFIVFDGEHGTIEPRDCEQMVRAAELRGVTPIVRATTNSPPVILRYMDTGAHGLHVPWVNAAHEAEAVVQATKYGPRGMRGLAGIRAADYGLSGTLAEYTRFANEQTLVIVHIETAEAVAAAEAIANTDGVDVVFIGPTDLSHSYGQPGDPGHSDVQAAMRHVIDAVARSGKVLGTMVPNAEAAREWHQRGARYITVNLEALLVPAARNFLSGARAP
ncbi:MAG: hypothetical protein H7Z42_11985 [Roseiflexaceae bacterium]|nr:hypothetical protein [Roseiflexaceae bacterium]